MRTSLCWAILFSAACFSVACARPPRPPLEDLSGHENLSSYKLTQIRGTRNGDRLRAEAMFADSSSTLTVEMLFAVGSPTRLASGQWQWTRNGIPMKGLMVERSVMFLGGQDGPPSIGGRFDLIDASGTALYRITIPTSELRIK